MWSDIFRVKLFIHLNLVTGDLNAIQGLIKRGVDIETKDKYGWTALHHSSLKGQMEIVKYLIENGTDIEATTQYGETALILSSTRGN